MAVSKAVAVARQFGVLEGGDRLITRVPKVHTCPAEQSVYRVTGSFLSRYPAVPRTYPTDLPCTPFPQVRRYVDGGKRGKKRVTDREGSVWSPLFAEKLGLQSQVAGPKQRRSCQGN